MKTVGFLLATATWLAALHVVHPMDVHAQDDTPAVEPAVDAPAGLPIFATLGFAFGQRQDGCQLCVSPDDDESFAAHLSVGKYLAHGLGVGVDASVWQRSRPSGLGGPADEDAADVSSLANRLGNASLVFSMQRWNVYLRAGGGLAWGGQDTLADTDAEGEESASEIVSLSGIGIGYTIGAGLTLPLHPMVSLAFFGNYNVGLYDMTSPTGTVVRDTSHEVVEIGIGVAIR